MGEGTDVTAHVHDHVGRLEAQRQAVLIAENDRLPDVEVPGVRPKSKVKLGAYATDRERLFLLLGVNPSFAQSEIMPLQRREVQLNSDPPVIDQNRPKTGVRDAFQL